MTTCPKCLRTSGDDWAQCRGSCPMPGSPHYTAEAESFASLSARGGDVGAWLNAKHPQPRWDAAQPIEYTLKNFPGLEGRPSIEDRLGAWLSAALEDPSACDEFKAEVTEWMNKRASMFKPKDWTLTREGPEAIRITSDMRGPGVFTASRQAHSIAECMLYALADAVLKSREGE